MKAKMLSMIMAVTLLASLAAPTMYAQEPAQESPKIPTVVALTANETSWEAIQDKLSGIYGEWENASYPGQISDLMVDTAIMGNGDIGVSSGGNQKEKTFHISKGDFWEADGGTQKAAGGYSISEYTPPTENENLAPKYRAVTVSSEDTWGLAHFGKEVAVSGVFNKNEQGYGWVSKDTDAPHWFAIEFESPITFQYFSMYNDGAARAVGEANNTRAFSLQTSEDGVDWSDIYSVTDNTENICTVTLEEPVSTKFVRVHITAPTNSSDRRARIGQLELYTNEPVVAPDVKSLNLALGKPVKVCDFISASQNGDKLVDGSYESKWCSTQNHTPHWGIVDLGENKNIAAFLLKNADEGKARITKDFQLQYLQDSVEISWESIQDESEWISFDEAVNNNKVTYSKNLEEPIEARYVRLLVTRPSAEEGSSSSVVRVNELELYAEIPPVRPDPYEKQDILNAQVDTKANLGEAVVEMKTWTSATKNIVVTEIETKNAEPVELQVDAWGYGKDNARPVETDINEDGSVTVSRSTKQGTWKSKVSMSSKIIGAEAVVVKTNNRGISTFEIKPNETVYIVTAVGGGGKTYDQNGNANGNDPVIESIELLDTINSSMDIAELHKAHKGWWKDYWSASYIDMGAGDSRLETIQTYYYGAQYIIGCTVRKDKLSPGIMGLWCTTDSPKWWGHYQLNYNHNAPVYGVGSSNRPEFGLPAFEVILDYAKEGAKRSASTAQLRRLGTEGSGRNPYIQKRIDEGTLHPTDGIPGGLFFPVGIGPWGSTTADMYHNETLCAAFSAFPATEYYKYTQDTAFLNDVLYDYLKACATFYETYLDKDEYGQYNIHAGYHENSWGLNPGIELSTVKYLFSNLIEYAKQLNKDEDKWPLWEEIYTNLAPQPTALYNGSQVYSLAEKNWNGSNYVDMSTPVPADGNMIPLETVLHEVIGYYSSQKELQLAHNTIDAFGNSVWGQVNNFPRVFTDAVRTRYSIETIITSLADVIEENIQPNLRIKDIYHGIEKSGAVESVNNMLLLGAKGIVKVFPNWLENQDASFECLRAPGAFVISAEYDGNAKEVKEGIKITSEVGGNITLAQPWASSAVVLDAEGTALPLQKGTAPNWEDETTITFATEKGKTYYVVKDEADVAVAALQQLYDANKNNVDEEYTPESWGEFTAALAHALDILNIENADQSDVKDASTRLQSALDNLEKDIKADIAALTKLHAACTQLVSGDYTGDSWVEMDAALLGASTVLADKKAVQAAVDTAEQALQSALIALVPISVPVQPELDTSLLKGTIGYAETYLASLAPGEYPENTWGAVTTALEQAKALGETPTQADVDDAAISLATALLALRPIVGEPPAMGYDALKFVVEGIPENSKTQADYTEASWADYASTLSTAKIVAAGQDNEYSQEEIDSALLDLLNKSKALVPASVAPGLNKQALQLLYDTYKDLTDIGYTEDSWNTFKAALTQAETTLQIASTQDELNTEYTSLATAKNALQKEEKPQTIPVTGITLNKSGITLRVNASETLVAKLEPDNASEQAVSWSSSDSAVATVDANGAVTAVSAGTSSITVTTTEGGKTATCIVTVNEPAPPPPAVVSVTGVMLNKNALTLESGTSETLAATVSPADAENIAVSWSSSDETIANVDANGVVTAKKAGGATITVITTDGGKTASCAVTVSPIKVAKVTLNMLSKDLKVKQSVQLNATVSPANAANKTVTWKSSNSKVAAVSKTGKVTAKKNGKATITATLEGESAKAAIRVSSSAIAVSSVKLSSSRLVLNVKGSAILKATVNPTKASNKKVAWASSNTAVASVSSSGKVTAKSVGKATITATSNEGGKLAKCTVTVKVAVSSVKISKTNITLTRGKTSTLKLTVAPKAASGSTVTWKTSNAKVASVSSSGRVKAIAKGTATITAAVGDKTVKCKITVK